MDNESREMIVDEEKVKAAAAAAGVVSDDDDGYVPDTPILKAFNIGRKIIENFCKLCLLGQVIVTSIVVAGRYIFNSTPGWGEELSLIFMVYFCTVSACLPIRKDEHLRMTLIEKIVPKKAVWVMDFIGYICMFIFGVVMIIAGWQLTTKLGRSMMPGLVIKRAWLFASAPICGVSICLSVLEKVVLVCRKR